MHDSPPATSLQISPCSTRTANRSPSRPSAVRRWCSTSTRGDDPGLHDRGVRLRDNLNSFASAGIRVLGVSKDDVAKLAAFAARDRLTYTLLSDTDLAVQQAYGVWGEKALYGKIVVGSIRSTFVIDEDGTIERAFYNVKATGHVARLRRDLGLDG